MIAGFVIQKSSMMESMIATGIMIMRGPRMLASTVWPMKPRKLSASIICLPDLLYITYFVLGLSLYIIQSHLTGYYSWLSFLFSSMSVTFLDFAFTTRTIPRIIQKMGPAGLWPAVSAPSALIDPRTIEIIPNVFMIL